ncbi:MAG: tryptophan--tRNA ligase [Alphaproteobacteria bacterium]|nr:tryptophan--tRNA ligase [Alphaproteobacteria bacterium]
MSLVFSGIQPTGNLHLGNYLGAVRQWVALQAQHPCLFCIVDLHAITVPQDPAALRQAVLEVAAAFIASGINPDKSPIYVQSRVAAHAELAWILSCHTPLGWLNRMTQFKEKAGKAKDNAVLGLYSYPVLMAADILLYRATHVPVGEDQKQHLELARDIAGAFNRHYNSETFILPEPLIPAAAARIMSLRDGTKKMSKSDESDYSRINLKDDNDALRLKIQKAKTDPLPLPETVAALEGRPEAANLLQIYAAITGVTLAEAVAQYAGQTFSAFKKDLTEALVAHLAPIREEMARLLTDPAQLSVHLKNGQQAAENIAQNTIENVRQQIGL